MQCATRGLLPSPPTATPPATTPWSSAPCATGHSTHATASVTDYSQRCKQSDYTCPLFPDCGSVLCAACAKVCMGERGECEWGGDTSACGWFINWNVSAVRLLNNRFVSRIVWQSSNDIWCSLSKVVLVSHPLPPSHPLLLYPSPYFLQFTMSLSAVAVGSTKKVQKDELELVYFNALSPQWVVLSPLLSRYPPPTLCPLLY